MEARKLRQLSKVEMAVLSYLLIKGISKPKEISSKLEIEISYVYKILSKLELVGVIIKTENNQAEYKALEVNI